MGLGVAAATAAAAAPLTDHRGNGAKGQHW